MSVQEDNPIADNDPGFDASQIHVGQYSFAPGQPPSIASEMSAPSGNDVFIVRFDHSVDQATVDRMRTQGIEILDFVPYFSVLARAPAQQMSILALDADVSWIGDYQPAYKFGEPRAALAKAGAYDVQMFPHATPLDAERLAVASGLALESYLDNGYPMKDIAVFRGQIDRLDVVLASPLAASAFAEKKMVLVDYFDPRMFGDEGSFANSAPRDGIIAMNDRSRAVSQTSDAWYADTNGYHKRLMGEGQIVGVADTGFDMGSTTNVLDDMGKGPLGNRVQTATGADNTPTDGGHGTHVSGSIMGNGYNSEVTLAQSTTDNVYHLGFAGQAPEAKLIHYKGLGTTSHGTMVTGGARVLSNSWGPVGSYGTYDSTSGDVDGRPANVLVLFAAGNDGPKDNTVGSGGAGAWNGLTICASLNDRPEDGSVDPNQVASFSGRGPFGGGGSSRIKPDLCHVGTSVISTRTRGVTTAIQGELTSWNSNGDALADYLTLQGTSMATPNTAGSALLVRDYLMDQKAVADPNAVLVKAYLVAGAVNMGYGFPSKDQGWGRVNVKNSISPPAPRTNQHEEKDISANGVWTPTTLNLVVKSPETPVKVSLVWTNTATAALQNNHDLIVEDPTGVKYNGNQYPLGSEWSSANPAGFDAANNIETVQVQNPKVGTWKVTIETKAISGTSKAAVIFSADVGPELDFRPAAKINGQFHFIVKQGATAAATMKVTNFGKMTDSITLAASGAPAGLVTFNPAGPLNLASGANQTVSITITAGTNTAKAYPVEVVAASTSDVGTPKTVSKARLNVDVIVQDYGTTAQITTTSRSDFDPVIVAFKDSANKEHVFVAWVATTATGDRVFLKHSGDGGVTWGGEMQVSTKDDGPNYLRLTYMPDIAANYKGRVLLTWTGTDPALESGFWCQLAFADPANYDTASSWSGSVVTVNSGHGNTGGSAYNVKRAQVPVALPSTGEIFVVFETLDYAAKPTGSENPLSVTDHVFVSTNGGTTFAEQNHYEVTGQYLFFPNAVADNGGNVQVFFYGRGSGIGPEDRDPYASIRKGTTWSCGTPGNCQPPIWDATDSRMFPAADVTQEGAGSNRAYVAITQSTTSESDKKLYVMYNDDEQATKPFQRTGPFGTIVGKGAYITGPVLDVDTGLVGAKWRTHVTYQELTNPWIAPQMTMIWSEDGFATKTDQSITQNSLPKGHQMTSAIGGKLFTVFFMKNPVDYNLDVYVVTHGTGGGGGNITPAVTLTAPVDQTTNVPVNSNIEITFNTPMDKAVTEGAISAAPAITGTFTWANGDTKVTWDPTADMTASTQYTVTVSTAAKSAAGVAMAAAKVFSFTTAGGGGNIPSVTATNPTNTAVNVPINTNIDITFSTAMDTAATGPAITIAPTAAGAVTWSLGDTRYTLDPTADLAPSTSYTVTISVAAKSSTGQNLPSAHAFSFTTGTGTAPTPPKVLGNTPASGAPNVPLNTNVAINFDLAMDKVATGPAFSIVPAAPGAIAWSNGDMTMTYDPTADLAASTEHTVSVSTGAKSAAGTAMAAAHTFKFTTGTISDATPPAIQHTPPPKVEEGTPIGISATVTDDIKVDSVTLKYKVAGGASFKSLAMPQVGTTDEYKATIPAADVKPDKAEYYIEAVDTAAKRATSPLNAPPAVHSVEVTKKDVTPPPPPPPPPSDPMGGLMLPLILIIVVAVVLALVAVMMMKRKKTPPAGMPPQMGGYPSPGGPPQWNQPPPYDQNHQWQPPPPGG